MSIIDKINSVQALALAGLERANNNVSMIQNIRITTGQILNFGSQVRSQGLNISLQIPDLSLRRQRQMCIRDSLNYLIQYSDFHSLL